MSRLFCSMWGLVLALWIASATGSSTPPPSPAFFRTRNAPRASAADTVRLLRRTLSGLSLDERSTSQENSTSLNKSWDDAVLFTYSQEDDVETKTGNASTSTGVEITCTTCYIKGTANARFTVAGDFNSSQAFHNFTEEVKTEIEDLGAAAVDYIETYIDKVAGNFSDGVDLDDFNLPPIDLDFDINLPEIPECQLQFRFDGLELYMLIDTVLSAGATYTLNLYTSNTPIGFAVGKNLEIGVIFSIDLILSVDGEIDISTGFHIKLEDGVTLDISMFSKDVSSVEFNGGQFEFLPVTIESAGVVFKAILRLGVQAGFEITSPEISVASVSVADASVGVEVGVYANVAEFITNVTASFDEDSDCMLQVEESYQLALGAMAGASVAIGDNTWGPVPETQVPIYYTTLASACAIQRRTTATSSSITSATSEAIKVRDDGDDDGMTTTTISTKVVYVGVGCVSEGLVNCPASLQTTTKFTTTKTLVTVIPTDSDASFPESTQTTALGTVPFGSGAQKLLVTSGSPVSYVPPPPPTTSSTSSASSGSGKDQDSIADGKDGGVPKRIVVGVSVGLGVPALVGVIAAIFFLIRRRKNSAVEKGEDFTEVRVVTSPKA
ncbi:hypothetical protein BGZ61DRAFT_442472 [Ilyonectria robusta]|uniref:uncharacterized protein n=1 Tax=Ilyonectria robusta TaxID=1079257 RepID=UPI001E8DC4D6|nr:uncharacterized protein BGZ61DRAFT_442472 [Ilyonectria robusta]KAH8734379.1 hypothetical protein BGZ61DRAFT_442472 [Ilyonectria robusta]